MGTRKPAGRVRLGLILAVAGIGLYALGFGVMAEWFFWDEFGVRFNFIAMDYLVYTREVVGNIRESFPVVPLLSALAIATLGLVWLSRGRMIRTAAPTSQRTPRVAVWLASGAIALGLSTAWSMDARHGANEYQKELSANGLYSMGYAFSNNEIDYFDFYATRAQTAVALQSELPRIVPSSRPKNVVIVTLESLSSIYMAHGGNTRNLTPSLDRLAGQGLFLANLRATGNRTVRGLEALSYSDYAVGRFIEMARSKPGSRTRCSCWWPTIARRARAAPACRLKITISRRSSTRLPISPPHRHPACQPD
ncbi:MAG: hypothetical protein R6W97_04875 [Thiobacillus sp.]